MLKTFSQIIENVKNIPIRTIAVAAAHDAEVLEAVKDAKEMGLADAILIGDKGKIRTIAKDIGMDLTTFELIHEPSDTEAALTATSLVSSGRAHMAMKGLLETSTFLKAVLDKEKGLRTGRKLSHVSVFEIPPLKKIIFITDAAMNIAPDLATKKQIIQNAVDMVNNMGIDCPKVAVLAAVEVVNPDMQATLDAACLSKMSDRGQIKNCIVDGPLALDNVLSKESAKHKGIQSPVAGDADILLVPSIETGNMIYKTMSYTTDFKHGGLLAGTSAPVILTSRTDSHETKLNSIALACLAAKNL